MSLISATGLHPHFITTIWDKGSDCILRVVRGHQMPKRSHVSTIALHGASYTLKCFKEYGVLMHDSMFIVRQIKAVPPHSRGYSPLPSYLLYSTRAGLGCMDTEPGLPGTLNSDAPGSSVSPIDIRCKPNVTIPKCWDSRRQYMCLFELAAVHCL